MLHWIVTVSDHCLLILLHNDSYCPSHNDSHSPREMHQISSENVDCGDNDSLSTPMGVDYVVIGFDMEVQPLATHNAA